MLCGAHYAKDVATLHSRLQHEWDFFRTPDELLKGDAAPVLLGQSRKRLVHNITACNDNISSHHRIVRQFAVLDFDTDRETLAEQHKVSAEKQIATKQRFITVSALQFVLQSEHKARLESMPPQLGETLWRDQRSCKETGWGKHWGRSGTPMP